MGVILAETSALVSVHVRVYQMCSFACLSVVLVDNIDLLTKRSIASPRRTSGPPSPTSNLCTMSDVSTVERSGQVKPTELFGHPVQLHVEG